MKRLYARVIEQDARARDGRNGASARSVATAEALAEAEARLGGRLAKTFVQFARAVGSTRWPVEIHAVEALAPYPPEWGRPSYLVAFATDGSGNDWCFDLRHREKGEYPIVFWDHEDPPDAAELEQADVVTTFDAWLEEQVGEALDEDGRADWSARQEFFERALEPHRETNTWPWAPSETDIAEVEREIGFPLPKDYVWFTRTFGSTPWPLAICDAKELLALTVQMRATNPRAKRGLIAFARDADGSFVAFHAKGRLEAVGGPPLRDRSFLALLERRIGADASPVSAPPAPVVVAPEVVPRNAFAAKIVDDEPTNSVWRAIAKAPVHCKRRSRRPCADRS
jgi:hypothetical protein